MKDEKIIPELEEISYERQETTKIPELGNIIREYEEQNNVERITEEELLDLVPESTLYPNEYFPLWGTYWDYGIEITDYEAYLLRKGENIVEPSPRTVWEQQILDEVLLQWNMTEGGYDLGDFGQLSENDQFVDLRDEYYDDLIDKHYDTSTSRNNMYINSDQNEVIDENDVTLYSNDLGYADSISQGEWECELHDEVESLPNGIRTKIVDVYVTDSDEAIKWYCSDLDNTTLHLRIHWDTGDAKFLIIVTDEEQCYFYDVFLDFENNKDGSVKFLGSCTYAHQVHYIIRYYIDTGDCYGHL